MAYYRKGRTTPCLRLALSEEPSSQFLAFTQRLFTKQIGNGAQWVELVIITLTSKSTHCVSQTGRLVLVGHLGGLFGHLGGLFGVLSLDIRVCAVVTFSRYVNSLCLRRGRGALLPLRRQVL